ncbi:MAG: GAF domain-containing sensor histidine kinase [Thermoleophilaceae bacterium]
MLELTEHDEALARLRELAAEQAALRRVATLVAGNAEPSEVFTRVCAELGAVLGIESTNLTRFEGGTQNVLAGWSVHGAPVFPVGEGVPLDGNAAVAKLSRSGRPERVDDYGGLEGELPERIRRAGIASAVAVPITVAGRLWGAVVASSGRPHGFPADTEERVAGFAELVADAVANADAREQLAASRARIVEVEDAERRRLERNLHDGAQQRLVALALDLRSVEGSIDENPAAAKRLLAYAREELGQALEELRELARGIHPGILNTRGLGCALASLAARAPVPVQVTALPRERLPEPVEAAAYYLVSEALTNVAKHARATEVVVSVTRTADNAQVEIRDDGVGGAALSNGSGLRGLADRVEALGGTLEVSSHPEDGTRLLALIPLGQPPGLP